MLVGQPQFGFSITDPFKQVGKFVVKTHVIGTKAIVKAIKDPRVQQAAAQYAQQKYGTQYAQGMDYYQQGRQLLRPPPGPMTPDGQPAMPDAEGELAPAASPVQHGNMLTIGAIVGVGLLAFLLLRK